MQRALLQDFYFLRDRWQFRKSLATVHGYIDHIIQNSLQRNHENASQSKKTRFVLLDELVTETRDPQELRDNTLTLLFAGRDTTASLLGWIMSFLARHPAAYDRLREEIGSQFEPGQSATLFDYNRLKFIQYLQWTINETLRLQAVVSLTHRVCVQDTVLPVGGGPDGSKPVVIMKGEKVFLYFYAAHRKQGIWGSDCLEFKPERWEGKRTGWEFLPFGGGPRVCVGRMYLNRHGHCIVMS